MYVHPAESAWMSFSAVSNQAWIDAGGEPGWTKARFGMGPWAARLVIDADQGTVIAEVELPGVANTERIESVVDALPFPGPQVTYSLDPDPVVVTLTYAQPLAGLDPQKALSLLGASALAASHIARGLWWDLAGHEQQRLSAFGFAMDGSFNANPPALLNAPPVPHKFWDGAIPEAELPHVPVPAAQEVIGVHFWTEGRYLVAAVAVVEDGYFWAQLGAPIADGPLWSSLVQETWTRHTLPERTTRMLVDRLGLNRLLVGLMTAFTTEHVPVTELSWPGDRFGEAQVLAPDLDAMFALLDTDVDSHEELVLWPVALQIGDPKTLGIARSHGDPRVRALAAPPAEVAEVAEPVVEPEPTPKELAFDKADALLVDFESNLGALNFITGIAQTHLIMPTLHGREAYIRRGNSPVTVYVSGTAATLALPVGTAIDRSVLRGATEVVVGETMYLRIPTMWFGDDSHWVKGSVEEAERLAVIALDHHPVLLPQEGPRISFEQLVEARIQSVWGWEEERHQAAALFDTVLAFLPTGVSPNAEALGIVERAVAGFGQDLEPFLPEGHGWPVGKIESDFGGQIQEANTQRQALARSVVSHALVLAYPGIEMLSPRWVRINRRGVPKPGFLMRGEQ